MGDCEVAVTTEPARPGWVFWPAMESSWVRKYRISGWLPDTVASESARAELRILEETAIGGARTTRCA